MRPRGRGLGEPEGSPHDWSGSGGARGGDSGRRRGGPPEPEWGSPERKQAGAAPREEEPGWPGPSKGTPQEPGLAASWGAGSARDTLRAVVPPVLPRSQPRIDRRTPLQAAPSTPDLRRCGLTGKGGPVWLAGWLEGPHGGTLRFPEKMGAWGPSPPTRPLHPNGWIVRSAHRSTSHGTRHLAFSLGMSCPKLDRVQVWPWPPWSPGRKKPLSGPGLQGRRRTGPRDRCSTPQGAQGAGKGSGGQAPDNHLGPQAHRRVLGR